jgi:uncharacterized repeat protein (TIGR03803 family)
MSRRALPLLLGILAASNTGAQSPTPAGFRALHTFEHIAAPSSLVQGSDGSFYGVTRLRQIFRVGPTGALTVWQPFKEDVSEAAIRLVRASNGNLYGLVTNYRYGLRREYLFHLATSGEVTTLHEFRPEEGFNPGGLIAGSDGFLYGALSSTDSSSRGAFFKVSTAGAFSIVHEFRAEEKTGYVPGAPIQGQDGNLYFLATYGGDSGNGALFRCTRAGVVTMLYSFSGGVDGHSPLFLTRASDGNFYVVHRAGGEGQLPYALSRITAVGAITEIRRFSTSDQRSALVAGSDGIVYGLNAGSAPDASVFKYSSSSGFVTIHQFAGPDQAVGGLILSNDVLYGIGTDRSANFGFIFRLPVAGGLTRLSEFRDGPAPFAPNGGLVQVADGTLYGTTTSGGPAGKGTVYKLAPDGTFTVLYAFEGPSDGASPVSLALGGDGALYGTTIASIPTLFRLTASGVFTTLDTFQFGYFTLAAGRDGTVYGTTGGGDRGAGYVFKIADDGTLTKLYQFTGGADGGSPRSLVHATDGNLYGCTSTGGANRSGTLFRLTPSGSLSVIRNFKFGLLSPRPGHSLVQASDGNLYYAISGESLPHNQHVPGFLDGVTLDGAPTGFRGRSLDVKHLVAGKDSRLYGIFAQPVSGYAPGGPDTVFSCTFSGSVTSLYQFNGTTEGIDPRALLQGSDGSLYGTLLQSGPRGGGMAYQLPAKPTATLRNISTRADVLSGDGALIAGFIVSGAEPKKVVIRGLGPSLAAAGLSDPLTDPTLQLFDAGGAPIAENDDWTTEPDINQTGLAPTAAREAAIVRTLAPGAYTTILRGKNNTTGVGLVELYDITGTAASSLLANISSRGVVGTADHALIAGFIVADQGGGFGRIVARAIGPSLADAGIQDPLKDPILQVFNSNGIQIASNDDWRSTQPDEIQETGIAPSAEKESAVVMSAPAGAYTAIVRGVNDTTGTALVEIYAQQQP